MLLIVFIHINLQIPFNPIDFRCQGYINLFLTERINNG